MGSASSVPLDSGAVISAAGAQSSMRRKFSFSPSRTAPDGTDKNTPTIDQDRLSSKVTAGAGPAAPSIAAHDDLAIQHARKVLDALDLADAGGDPIAASDEMENLRQLLRSMTSGGTELNKGEAQQLPRVLNSAETSDMCGSERSGIMSEQSGTCTRCPLAAPVCRPQQPPGAAPAPVAPRIPVAGPWRRREMGKSMCVVAGARG